VIIDQLDYIFVQNYYWYGETYMSDFVNRMHVKENERLRESMMEYLREYNAKVCFFCFTKLS
jgi:hypothetical protein